MHQDRGQPWRSDHDSPEQVGPRQPVLAQPLEDLLESGDHSLSLKTRCCYVFLIHVLHLALADYTIGEAVGAAQSSAYRTPPFGGVIRSWALSLGVSDRGGEGLRC